LIFGDFEYKVWFKLSFQALSIGTAYMIPKNVNNSYKAQLPNPLSLKKYRGVKHDTGF